MTATLPAAIAPWAPWLSWFADDLRDQLAPLVRHLHPLLAGVRQRAFEQDGEPDGFDGLRRRGAYERLLGTEWLLADELPDEFLRRAAAGEHLFFAPKPRGQRTTRLIVALFDAGPAQLGAARLAHMALWVLLARRAAQCGGEFRWGLMQSPGTLHDARAPADLAALLQGRSFELADAGHAARWQEVLAGLPVAAQECWLIGAAHQPPDVRPRAVTHRIGVAKAVHGDVLDVALLEGGSPRSATLPLPAGEQAVMLLKRPFSTAPVARPRPRGVASQEPLLSRPPVIAMSGSRVVVSLADGTGALVFHTGPGSAKASGPREMRWRAVEEAITLTLSGKKLMALCAHDATVRIWEASHFREMPRPDEAEFEAAAGLDAYLPSASLMRGAAQRYLVLDQGGRLVRWKPGAGYTEPSFDVLDDGVLGMCQRDDHSVLYVAADADGITLRASHGDPRATEQPRICLPACDADAALFGDIARWRRGTGACALRFARTPGERWQVNTPRTLAHDPGFHRDWQGGERFATAQVDLAADESAIGLLAADTTASRPCALLVLDAERRRLMAHDGTRSTLVYTAPARILSASFCPSSNVAAMLTEQHQLIVLDVASASLRLIQQLAEGPGA